MINTQVKLSIKSEINTTTFTFDDAVNMLSKGNKEPQHLELLILSLNDNIEYHMDEEYDQHKDNPQALIDEASNNIEDV